MTIQKYLFTALLAGNILSSGSLAAQDVLAPATRIALHTHHHVGGQQKLPSQQNIRAFMTYDAAVIDWNELESMGVKVGAKTASVATLSLPIAQAEQLAKVKGVNYLQIAGKVEQQLDKARQEAGVELTQQGEGLTSPLTGKGVVIGIVDKGFDYTHKAFYDTEGRLRISRVWEQITAPTDRFHAPAHFGYGAELLTQTDLEWAQGDVVNNSHGTHVTGIAAGSSLLCDGIYRGVAPDAEIVLVCMDANSENNVAIADAIAYIFNYADSVGKPCVVNLSLGMQIGPHDGTSPFDLMADEMQGAGRLLVGSAGNHRADKFHISKTFENKGESVSTFVNFYGGPTASTAGGEIDIWGGKETEFEVNLMAYNTFNKEVKQRITIYPATTDLQTVKFDSYISDSLLVATERNPLNNKPHIHLTSAVGNLRNNYALGIEIVSKKAGTVDIWADNIFLGLTSKEIEGFAEPSEASTIAELGGTARRLPSVGAYTTRNEYTIYRDPTVRKIEETMGEIWSHSSYGPTADGRMKPEVAAPGCLIISALCANDNSGTQIVATSEASDTRNYLYGYMQGTSMSAPFITGAVATWLQAYPSLTPEELKEVVKETARRDEATGDEDRAATLGFGYGKIDVWAGAKNCVKRAATGIDDIATPNNHLLLIDGNGIRLAFTTPTEHALMTLRTIDGKTVMNKSYSNIDAGTEFLPLEGTSLHGIYLLTVETEKGTICRKVVL